MYNKSVARRVMKGDPDAFRILYDDWAEKIYAWAWDILGGGEWTMRAVKLCFAEAYRRSAQLKEESGLEQWLTDICAGACAAVAREKRSLDEAQKESIWQELAKEAGIATMEAEKAAEQPQEQEEADAQDDWKPIIFLPDEEDMEKPEQAEAPVETAPPAKKAEPEKPKRPRSARKVGALITGALVLLAVAAAGGAAVLMLASAGTIRLPESLSGAAAALALLGV